MLAYRAICRSGQECPHCEHVFGPDENPREHETIFHRDRIEAKAAYDGELAQGRPIHVAQASYNAVLRRYAPGPGHYPRFGGQQVPA